MKINLPYMKFFDRSDWKYAFLEIVLIFVGITLAFLFENWNQERNDRKMEILVLKELVYNLELDSADLEYNINSDHITKQSFIIMQKIISEKLSFDDSLAYHFGRVGYFTNFIENKSAFENLKSIGFNFVSNDSIRSQIIKYYDVSVQNLTDIETNIINTHENDIVKPFMIKHFNYSAQFEPAYPNEYDVLIADPEFKSIVATTNRLFDWKISLSESCIRSMIALKSNLIAEIKRLE